MKHHALALVTDEKRGALWVDRKPVTGVKVGQRVSKRLTEQVREGLSFQRPKCLRGGAHALT